MRAPEVAREAWRDVQTGTARTLIYAGLLAGIVCLLAITEMVAIRGALAAAVDFRDRGGSVTVLTAKGSVDAAVCNNLDELSGARAGAIRRAATDLRAATLPQAGIPTFEATAGILAILQIPATTEPGVALSDAAAQTLGVRQGDQLRLVDGQRLRVRAVFPYPDDGRRPGLGYAAIFQSPAVGQFDECWLRTWPQSRQADTLVRLALTGGDNPTDATVAQLNPSMGLISPGPALYQHRATRLAPLAGLIAGLLTGLAAMRLRRLELASARHAGVSPAAAASIAALSFLPAVIAAAAISAAPLAIVAAGAPADQLAVAAAGVRVQTATLLSVLVGVTAGALAVRERHLFAYFKSR